MSIGISENEDEKRSKAVGEILVAIELVAIENSKDVLALELKVSVSSVEKTKISLNLVLEIVLFVNNGIL